MFGRLASLVAAGAMTLSLSMQAAHAEQYRGYTSDDYYRAVDNYRADQYRSDDYAYRSGDRYDRYGNYDQYRRSSYGSYARCEDEDWSNDQLVGTALGAILGGVIGHQFGKGRGKDAATIAGVFIGGFAGNRIARNMDCRDQQYAQRTYYRAYEYGRPGERYSWYNPQDRSHYGYVTPSRWYEGDYGQRCREYTQTIFIDGRRQTATGTACRNRDGSWRIVS